MVSGAARFSLRHVEWQRDSAAVRTVREAVFVIEQRVPVSLEWDGVDPQCVHVLAEIDGIAVGTGRLLPDGHIGRMAVLAQWRGQGIGAAMLDWLLDIARKRKMTRIVLHSQSHAIAFYERAGFRIEGEEFMEAGIAHRRMTKTFG